MVLKLMTYYEYMDDPTQQNIIFILHIALKSVGLSMTCSMESSANLQVFDY